MPRRSPREGPDEPETPPTATPVADAAPVVSIGCRAPPPARRDVVAEIERLAQLRASGALSEAEFEVMKVQALGQGGRA